MASREKENSLTRLENKTVSVKAGTPLPSTRNQFDAIRKTSAARPRPTPTECIAKRLNFYSGVFDLFGYTMNEKVVAKFSDLGTLAIVVGS